MDHLQRVVRLLGWFVVGVLVAFVGVQVAHAETISATSTPITSRPGYWSTPAGGACTQRFYDTIQESCAATRCAYPQFSAWSSYDGNATPGRCICGTAQGCPYNNYYVQQSRGSSCVPEGSVSGTACVQYSCPAGQNWTLSGTQCTRPDCVAPQVRQPDGTCEAPPCVAGSAGSVTTFSGCYDVDGISNGCDVGRVMSPPRPTCDGSCLLDLGPLQETCWRESCGSPQCPIMCTDEGVKTGGVCTVSDAVAAPSAPCAPGYSLGTVNGISRCVASSAPAQTASSTSNTVTNPDTSTTTTTVTVDNSTNTTTTTVTNVGPGGGPTSSTTSKAPSDPSKPMGQTDEEANDDFCKANPSHPMCAQSKVSGGGDCAVVPVCEGDAANCAVVLQTWKTRCALEPTQAQSDAFTSLVAGSAEEVAEFKSGTEVGVGSISEGTPWLPRGGVEDVTVTVMGRDLVVPLSRANDVLEIMGMIVVAFAWLSAARIVGIW